MLSLTPPPDRAIPVLWQNFIRKFNVPGRLDTVPSAHSRSPASVRFLPQTRTPLHVGAKCGRPHRGSNRALTTGTSVGFRRSYPLGHGGDYPLDHGGDHAMLCVMLCAVICCSFMLQYSAALCCYMLQLCAAICCSLMLLCDFWCA